MIATPMPERRSVGRRLCWELPLVYFVHIPKAAGTSLRKLLTAAYGWPQILALEIHTLHCFTLADLVRYRCILSHFGLGMYRLIGKPDLACVTILRDPVERSISDIYYRQQQVVRSPALFHPSYLAMLQPESDADLAACVENAGYQDRAFEQQTRSLGVLYDYRPYLADGVSGRMGQPALDPLPAPELTGENDMTQVTARAHAWLSSMAVVGLAERFAESVELIFDALGAPAAGQLPRANIGPRNHGPDGGGYRNSAPPEVVETLMALTRRDQELYAHATDLFEAQWARHARRRCRSYSIAPRLRGIVRRTRQGLPGVVRAVRRRWQEEMGVRCD